MQPTTQTTAAQITTVSLTFGPGQPAVRLSFDLTRTSQRFIYDALQRFKSYDSEVERLLFRVLRPGDVFVDVGAHFGFFSLLGAGLVGAEGLVLSVEPDQDNFAHLLHHIADNGLTTVRPVNAVACEAEGTRIFHVNSDNDGGHTLWDPGSHPFNKISATHKRPTEVRAVTIDARLRELAAGNRPVRLIKIDTEGAECLVLAGTRETLAAADSLFIVAELNEFGLEQMGQTQDSLRGLMRAMGYETFLLRGDGSLPCFCPAGTRVVQRRIGNLLFARPDSLSRFWPEVAGE